MILIGLMFIGFIIHHIYVEWNMEKEEIYLNLPEYSEE